MKIHHKCIKCGTTVYAMGVSKGNILHCRLRKKRNNYAASVTSFARKTIPTILQQVLSRVYNTAESFYSWFPLMQYGNT